jgi:hypothetical protein
MSSETGVVELERLEETQFLSEAGGYVNPILGLGEVLLRRTKKTKCALNLTFLLTTPTYLHILLQLGPQTQGPRCVSSDPSPRPKVSEGVGSRFTSSSDNERAL